MSKAFTREDDGDRQNDPLPERTISKHPNLVTADGLRQIEAEIARVTKLHNAARVARDSEGTAASARDLRYWNARLATAQVTEFELGASVQFGARVTLKRFNGSTRAYRIVGSDEANPKEGTLSYLSPLAQVLIDKHIGDVITVGATREEIVGIA